MKSGRLLTISVDNLLLTWP